MNITKIEAPEQVIARNNERIRLLPDKVRMEFSCPENGKSKDLIPNKRKSTSPLTVAISVKTKHLDILFLKK